MAKKNKIHLTEQTFQDAGGKEIFGRLKMVGPVYVDERDLKSEISVQADVSIGYENVNFRLENKAREMGAKYVFDINYKIQGNEITLAKGTAYKKRSLIGRLR